MDWDVSILSVSATVFSVMCDNVPSFSSGTAQTLDTSCLTLSVFGFFNCSNEASHFVIEEVRLNNKSGLLNSPFVAAADIGISLPQNMLSFMSAADIKYLLGLAEMLP